MPPSIGAGFEDTVQLSRIQLTSRRMGSAPPSVRHYIFMPKAAIKRAPRKGAKAPASRVPQESLPPDVVESLPVPLPPDPPSSSEMKLEPPTTPVRGPPGCVRRRAFPSGPVGGTVNIAELQAMAMPDLNAKARDMGIENFGTMRKHELIFQILQKNAERAGVLFSEGVLEILPDGFGFLRSTQL